MQTIGFIGLGAMGSGMAARQAAAGRRVRVFDLSMPAIEAACANGCVAAASPAEAAGGADAVITMLPTGRHVREVLHEGVFAASAPAALIIDCSTIAVHEARELAQDAEKAGRTMIDAPVSGGVAGAQAGSLAFMVGGPDAVMERAREALAPMAKAVVHAGGPGAGQAAKICNNMLLAISMIGTCEAFALAERLGLAPSAFFEIASQSSGQSWSMTSYAPVPGLVPSAPSNRDFEGGFAGGLMLKDLTLALSAAEDAGLAPPLGSHARALFARYVEEWGPARDFSGIIDMLRKQ